MTALRSWNHASGQKQAGMPMTSQTLALLYTQHKSRVTPIMHSNHGYCAKKTYAIVLKGID